MEHSLVELLRTTIKLAIFDIDQTLMDTTERNNDAVTYFMRELGLGIDKELRQYVLSHSARHVAERVSSLLGRAVTAEEVERTYVEGYHASVLPIRVPPETMPIIYSLRERGIMMAAATSASPPIVFYNLTALQAAYQTYAGESSPFDAIAYAEEGLPHKPDPAVGEVLQTRLGRKFDAESILVIGDSLGTDGRLAQNMGAWFRHINGKYTLNSFYRELERAGFLVPHPHGTRR